MKRHFCTLFDSGFLTRGLALYESLVEHCPDFHLYVFAFDTDCERVLKQRALPFMTVISLSEFEDEELLRVKPTRNRGEYCWTATSSTIRFVLQKFAVDACTYLDADLCFYDDPSLLLQEMGDCSIQLTEHRYTAQYDKSVLSGKYCVQFMTFKNTPAGLKALDWWRTACLDWCFDRFEEGKFGDQKYLDDWLSRFEGVQVLRHLGGGVAPWNVQQFKLVKKDDKVFFTDKKTKVTFPLVFYHFHGVRFFADHHAGFDNYKLDKAVLRRVYFPYVKQLLRLESEWQTLMPGLDQLGRRPRKVSVLSWLKNQILGTYNFFPLRGF